MKTFTAIDELIENHTLQSIISGSSCSIADSDTAVEYAIKQQNIGIEQCATSKVTLIVYMYGVRSITTCSLRIMLGIELADVPVQTKASLLSVLVYLKYM